MNEWGDILLRAVAVGIGPIIGVVAAVLISRRIRRKGLDAQDRQDQQNK